MKNILITLSILTLALFTSCTKGNADETVQNGTIAVTISTEVNEDSKTAVTTYGHSSWTADDTLGVAYAAKNTDSWIDSGRKFTSAGAGETTVFSGSIAAPEYAGKYNLYALHPYSPSAVWTSPSSVKITLPQSQTAKNGKNYGYDATLDSSADILISDAKEIDLTASTANLSDVKLSFARMNAIASVRVEGISRSDVSGNDQVQTVTVSTDAAEGLAGDMTVDFTSCAVSMTDARNSVSLILTDKPVLSALVANLCVAPVTIPSGKSITIEIETVDYKLSKKVTLSSPLALTSNLLEKFVCEIDSGWTKQGESTDFAGSGTSADPYLIQNYKDMLRLSVYTNGSDYASYTKKYYKMTADIDMTLAGNFTPICSAAGSNTFKGTFDGDNHCIYNLTITNSITMTGLFGYIGYKDNGSTLGDVATVKNIKIGTKDGTTYDGVSKVTFSTTATGWSYVAAFCAATYNGIISGIDNYMPVEIASMSKGKIRAGALSGIVQYRSTYDKCNNYAEVNNYNAETEFLENLIGGLFGTIANSTDVTITSCNNYGNVLSTSPSCTCLGGIYANVSSAQYLKMSSCKNYGAVTLSGTKALGTTGARLGGVAAYINSNTATMTSCENYGTISSTFVGLYSVGGVLGGSLKNPTITSCRNFGEISVDSNTSYADISVGGVCGRMDGGITVDSCTNTGSVKAVSSKPVKAGGIAGSLVNASAKLKKSDFNGSVEGTSPLLNIGAVAGSNIGTVTDCTVAGYVGGTALTSSNFNSYVCGSNTGTITGTAFGTH